MFFVSYWSMSFGAWFDYPTFVMHENPTFACMDFGSKRNLRGNETFLEKSFNLCLETSFLI